MHLSLLEVQYIDLMVKLEVYIYSSISVSICISVLYVYACVLLAVLFFASVDFCVSQPHRIVVPACLYHHYLSDFFLCIELDMQYNFLVYVYFIYLFFPSRSLLLYFSFLSFVRRTNVSTYHTHAVLRITSFEQLHTGVFVVVFRRVAYDTPTRSHCKLYCRALTTLIVGYRYFVVFFYILFFCFVVFFFSFFVAIL